MAKTPLSAVVVFATMPTDDIESAAMHTCDAIRSGHLSGTPTELERLQRTFSRIAYACNQAAHALNAAIDHARNEATIAELSK